MRMVLPVAASVIALLWSLAGVRAAEIPEVKSPADLQALAPIVLADGWKVRIGLGDAWPAGVEGPWKMLYCMAEAPAGDTKGIQIDGEIPGEMLGPVFYTCSWDDQKATGPLVVSEMGVSSEVTREVRIAFGLPSGLGALKVGDRVDLQVLYVPRGHRLLLPAPGPRGMLVQMALFPAETPALPVLSNRMSFVITQELLAAGRGR